MFLPSYLFSFRPGKNIKYRKSSHSCFSLLDTLMNWMSFDNWSTVAFSKFSAKPFDPSYFQPIILILLQIWVKHPLDNLVRGLKHSRLSGWLQCKRSEGAHSRGRCLKQTDLLLSTVWDCLLCFGCLCCLYQYKQGLKINVPP